MSYAIRDNLTMSYMVIHSCTRLNIFYGRHAMSFAILGNHSRLYKIHDLYIVITQPVNTTRSDHFLGNLTMP